MKALNTVYSRFLTIVVCSLVLQVVRSEYEETRSTLSVSIILSFRLGVHIEITKDQVVLDAC